ncbi:helix-turn-helix domain-containing protein [Rhizobium sp. YTU87027]|uniref:helix-turn-helix domain-containing protein n=1 Tax=Rhizobium sp. YTU87027 TaxID=3417741 RepID=UPI003D68B5B9
MPIANFALPGASVPSFPQVVTAQGAASGFASPPATMSVRAVCRICAQITTEMVMLASHRIQMRRDRRRTLCHIRQIAMYVCHVALQIALYEIGGAFGRDRTTVDMLAMSSRIAVTIRRSTNSSRPSNGRSILCFDRTGYSGMNDANKAMVNF